MPKLSPNSLSTLTTALRLHERGLSVVPCNGKAATVKGWNERRLSADELRSTLDGSSLNIAIVLNQSDLIDVECDTPEAEAALLAMFGGAIPQTPSWRSTRGIHRLFRRPQGLPSKAKVEIDGIEFRIANGKGAASVVPPSIDVETGVRRRWLSGLSFFDLDPAELPTTVAARLVESKPISANGAENIPEGQRNDWLFKLGCRLVRGGVKGDSLAVALGAENQTKCDPPLGTDEVIGIARSAENAAAEAEDNPTQALLRLCERVELWKTPDGQGFATVPRGNHSEHWRLLKSLLDPNAAPIRSSPKGERDLMIAASNAHIVAFDNLSYVDGDLSDALCRLATGNGFATRRLYTNDEEQIFAAARPILMNGIEDVGYRSDLLDRSVIVELPRIEASERRPEKLFWAEFEEARPRILGALLDAASTAMRNLPAIEASDVEWPRMADFAQWVSAAEPALRLEPGEFLAAYEANREAASRSALESTPVVTALIALLESSHGQFSGTAAKLLESLKHFALPTNIDTRDRAWPKNPRALSGVLNRLAPNLRRAGIEIERDVKDNQKLLSIRFANSQIRKTNRKDTPNASDSESTPVERKPRTGLALHLRNRAGRDRR